MNNLSLIRWAGGKGKMLDALLPFIPHSRVYIEPFGGGASILLNRRKSPVEVYNDLDHALVNLFSVVRDEKLFAEFSMQVGWTPYARKAFEEAVENHDNPDLPSVQRAVLFFTMMNQGISGKRLAGKSEWSRSGKQNLSDRWFKRHDKLGAIHDRLRGVQVECRDALDVLQEWDGPDVTFYCDPPYILETRKQTKYYAIEPGDDYHEQLVDVLLNVKGMVILSGYNHPIYERLADAGWKTDVYSAKATMTVTKIGEAQGGRVEIVYRNPLAADMGERRPLFL